MLIFQINIVEGGLEKKARSRLPEEFHYATWPARHELDSLFENDGDGLPCGGTLFETAVPVVPADERGVAGSVLFENDSTGPCNAERALAHSRDPSTQPPGGEIKP